MSARHRTVSSADLDLAVTEHTPAAPGRPHVILVHGYPENQRSWDTVVSLLGPEFHLITYDVRGAGASGVPTSVVGYRTEQLVEDLLAVVRATVPDDEPFHLVGHDWGSVQLFDVLAAETTDARLRGRIASFTSLSGPPLDHVADLARPDDRRGRARALRQLTRSWYVLFFQLPFLPELAWRSAVRRLRPLAVRTDPGMAHLPWDDQQSRDGRHGVGLYRANVLTRLRHPRAWRSDVPVHLLVPRRDRYLTPYVVAGLERRCPRLTRVDLDAGHWLVHTHPATVATEIRAHVRRHA